MGLHVKQKSIIVILNLGLMKIRLVDSHSFITPCQDLWVIENESFRKNFSKTGIPLRFLILITDYGND
jgi:hypothetical protein